jgi:hypothetical protein
LLNREVGGGFDAFRLSKNKVFSTPLHHRQYF